MARQRLPDSLLELGAADIQRQVYLFRRGFDEIDNLPRERFQSVVVTAERGFWKPGPQLVDQFVGRGVELYRADAFIRVQPGASSRWGYR